LLRIAQIEAGTRKSRFAKFDFSQLLTSVYEDFAPVIEDNSKTLMARFAPNLEIVDDRQLLTQLVVNLLENAIQHTPAGVHIVLNLVSKQNTVVLSVIDDEPGVPASDFDRLFHRFYRVDRSRSGTGNGLGLSLVRAVSDLHNGTIKFQDNKPGLLVELCLPSPQQ
jgi:signal transduction histidine kinase